MKNIQHSTTWFNRIPRGFFRFPIVIYSIYVGFGFFLSGILHFQIWNKSNQVETIFSNFNININKPTPIFALSLFIITGLISTIVFQLLFRKIRREAGILELIFWGTFISLIFSWIPWFYASSIVSTIFLFLFCMISLAGFGLSHRLLYYMNYKKKAPDSWKMFVNATKACAAVLAILLGAITTSVLLPWRNTHREGFELLRYALLCAYVVFGMLGFIIMPLLVRSLENEPVDDVDLEPPGLI